MQFHVIAYSFLQHPVTSSLFGLNIPSILFSNAFILCASLDVTDQVLRSLKEIHL
jgi:hypothetical protein